MNQQNAIVSTHNFYSPEKIALIKRTIAEGASDDELALFIAQCQRTGLDPFSRQIYSIQRQVYDPKLNRKVSRMVTQVSIDGLRLIAERSGLYAGQVGPYFSGPLPAIRAEQEDPAEHSERVDLMRNQEGVGNYSVWSDIWSSTTYPFAAKVGVIRKDFAEPLYSVAYWSEYCPIFDGKPSLMWSRFPTLMLAKCAEASALRRAFPQELAGLFTPEESRLAAGDLKATQKKLKSEEFSEDSPIILETSTNPVTGLVSPEVVATPALSGSAQADPNPTAPDIKPEPLKDTGSTLSAVKAHQGYPDLVGDQGRRPYAPLRLQARLSEVAAECPAIAAPAFDQVSTFLRETIPSPVERGRVMAFLTGNNDIRAASPLVLCAIHRWLKFDDISKPSVISLQELNAVRTHLSTQLNF